MTGVEDAVRLDVGLEGLVLLVGQGREEQGERVRLGCPRWDTGRGGAPRVRRHAD
jgi:hypothetical protein